MSRKAAKKARPKSDSTRARARGPGRPSRGAAPEQAYPAGARVIKRYGNRRLYDPVLSRCVTMSEIAGMVKDGLDVRVVDGDTGEDLSKRVLVQIILEEQNAAQLELLPVSLLHQIIALRQTPIAGWLAQYLQAGAEFLARQADGAGPSLKNMTESMGALFPWLDASAWQQQAAPFAAGFATPPSAPRPPATDPMRRELDELERKLADLNARMNQSGRNG